MNSYLTIMTHNTFLKSEWLFYNTGKVYISLFQKETLYIHNLLGIWDLSYKVGLQVQTNLNFQNYQLVHILNIFSVLSAFDYIIEDSKDSKGYPMTLTFILLLMALK